MKFKLNPPLFLLSISLFFTGASGLISEYILATVSSYILGSSIEQFSITMALMLGFMGIGGWVQKYVSNDNLITKFILLELILAYFTSFAPIAIYGAFGLDNFYLVYYLFVAAIGFFVGFEIPFITRINAKYTKSLKENLSWIFSMDYLGAMVGGAIVWTLFLLPNVPLTQIGFLVASFNLFIAIITFYYFSSKYKLPIKLFTMLFIITLGAFYYSYSHVLAWGNILEQNMYKDPIVFSTTTKYQHLVITENPKVNDIRLYINGNTQFSSTDEQRYHELLVHPILSLDNSPQNVLVFGGGDGLAVREIKKHQNIQSITLIDIDKDMISLSKNNPIIKKLNHNSFEDFKEIDLMELEKAKQYFNYKNQKGNFIIFSDANTFLNGFIYSKRQKKYDTVIIDLPDPSSLQINKLYTIQFYKKLKILLSDNGKVVIQSTSPYYAKEAFLMIGRTLKKAGFYVTPYHANIPSFGEWGWWIGTIKKNINLHQINITVPTSFLTNDFFKSSLVFGKNELKSNKNDINSLMEPKLLEIYNKESWQLY